MEAERKSFRRGARVVEWGGLENRCTLAGTVGSNPTLSAIHQGPPWEFPWGLLLYMNGLNIFVRAVAKGRRLGLLTAAEPHRFRFLSLDFHRLERGPLV